MTNNGVSRSAEWELIEANAAEFRLFLERGLRRELVHDPRAGAVRIQNVSVVDLADEAIAWGLENWKAKPTATAPELWILKHALQLLDEALDTESLAAESRAEERQVERRLIAHDLFDDLGDEQRAEWLDMAGLAARGMRREKDRGDDEPFDGLVSDPQVSSPAARFDHRETILELERAMLRLPERRRKAVAHHFLDGLSKEEIAYLMDMSLPGVDAEIAQGIADLHADLASS